MEARKIAKKKWVVISLIDPRQIQRLNQQAEDCLVLFGPQHLFEPNFVSSMPLPENPLEEELLGVEYIYSQSSDFKTKDYYIHKGMMKVRTYNTLIIFSIIS